jgi:vacuolar-type H+-ATPase subunit H
LGVFDVPREVVLGKLRDAELLRRQLEEQAQKKKDAMLQDARLAAQKILEDAAVAADAAASKRIELEVQKVSEERSKITSASHKDTARKREASQARLAQAASYMVNELVRQLNA